MLVASRIRLDSNGAAELRQLLGDPIEWATILKRAIPHGVIPLMFRNLNAVAADLVPESLITQLGDYATRIRARNDRAQAQLAGLLDKLEAAGVDAIPFKGMVLQRTVYAGLPLREFADIDLMIRRESVIRAAEILQGDGYHLAERQRAKGLSGLVRKGDAAEFHDGVDSTSIDLHWTFTNLGFDFRLDPESLEAEMESIEIAGRPTQTYGPNATLLILCAHQAKHRWRRLNWLCDVAALLENREDAIRWPVVLARARLLRCERIVLTTLALTETLLSVRLPDPVHDRLKRDTAASILVREVERMILEERLPRRSRLYVQMREGNRITACSRYLISKLHSLLA
jgi:hypothetical protein